MLPFDRVWLCMLFEMGWENPRKQRKKGREETQNSVYKLFSTSWMTPGLHTCGARHLGQISWKINKIQLLGYWECS
jgi:hypothetical protein